MNGQALDSVMGTNNRESDSIRLAIAGAWGRMGRCVMEGAVRDPRFTVVAALVADISPSLANSVIPLSTSLTARCDVFIDFTNARGTLEWLPVCVERRIPMVIGATGHDGMGLARVGEAAKVIPIVKAANFSLGIHVIARLLRHLVTQLGSSFDVEIVETHHRHKADAPSGTALMLLDEILGAAGRTRDSAVFGREGRTGARPAGQIGVHAVRMGDVVGAHEVLFSGNGETVSVKHTAHSRDAFAVGALQAAAWIVGKPPGLYGLNEVINPG